MSDSNELLLQVVQEIRELLRLMAEPAIAQRDEKRRVELRQIVGRSAANARAVHMLDGSKPQSEIAKGAKIDRSNLSKLVKALRSAELVNGDEKPKLTIPIPQDFFEDGGKN